MEFSPKKWNIKLKAKKEKKLKNMFVHCEFWFKICIQLWCARSVGIKKFVPCEHKTPVIQNHVFIYKNILNPSTLRALCAKGNRVTGCLKQFTKMCMLRQMCSFKTSPMLVQMSFVNKHFHYRNSNNIHFKPRRFLCLHSADTALKHICHTAWETH